MCTCHSELYPKRRRAFLDFVKAREPDAVCVLAAAPVFTRNNDVEHEYRQDSDLYYLTGFSEPGTWRIDRVARIETQVWSLAGEGTLVWAGMSETVNPRDIPAVAATLSGQDIMDLSTRADVSAVTPDYVEIER